MFSKMKFFLIALLSQLLIWNTATAASITSQAMVTIKPSATLARTAPLEFNNFSECDRAQSSTCGLESTPALFDLNVNEDQLISVNVTPADSSKAVDFQPVLVSNQTPDVSEGKSTLKVVGNLTMNSSLKGSHKVSYVVNVNYN